MREEKENYNNNYGLSAYDDQRNLQQKVQLPQIKRASAFVTPFKVIHDQ